MGFEESLGDPRDRDTPEADLRALATSQDPIVRLHIAHNPSTPGDVLAMLAMQDGFEIDEFEEDWEPIDYEEDPYFGDDLNWRICDLHDVIARNPHTPADVLENLYFNGSSRSAVSSNPRLPDAVVRKIWATGDVENMHNIIDLNTSLSDAFMIEVASSPDFWIGDDSIKSALASREDCPLLVLELLLRQDPGPHDRDVKAALARRESLPLNMLLELAEHDEPMVRGAVVWNPSTPPNLLAQLASDPSEDVRFRVAMNDATGSDLLTQLAKDSNDSVRRGVAQNSSTLPHLLTQLAGDVVKDVREAVAANPSTPSEVRAKLEGEDS